MSFNQLQDWNLASNNGWQPIQPIGEPYKGLPVWNAPYQVERVYELGGETPYEYISRRQSYLPPDAEYANSKYDVVRRLMEESVKPWELMAPPLISPSVTPYPDYNYEGSGAFGPLPGGYKRTLDKYPTGLSGPTGPTGPTGQDGDIGPQGYVPNIKPAQNQRPNKMANDKWDNKVAWNSSDLFERQLSLETYSAEVAMMTEAIRQVARGALGTEVETEDLEFYANFASPIQDNQQMIAITLNKPISLAIKLTRALVKGKLDWRIDVGVTRDTPERVEGRMLDMSKVEREAALNGIDKAAFYTNDKKTEKSKEKKRRKIRL